MAYPDDIDEFREAENVPGLAYDENDKKTLFAEDFNAITEAIVNIEEFVGSNADITTSPLYLLIANALYPVGKIVEFATDFDPNTSLGFGTWAYHSEGKVTVSKDASDSKFDTLGEAGGSLEHHHEHVSPIGYINQDAFAFTNGTYLSKLLNGRSARVDPETRMATTNNNSSGNIEIWTINSTDESSLQPYEVVARWVRTA